MSKYMSDYTKAELEVIGDILKHPTWSNAQKKKALEEYKQKLQKAYSVRFMGNSKDYT